MRAASSLEDFDKSSVYSIALLIGRGEASLTICVEREGEVEGRRGGSRVLRNTFKEISLKGRACGGKGRRGRRSLLKGQFDRGVKPRVSPE